MIRDARQLKAKIQQLTQGHSQRSQIYLRNFFAVHKSLAMAEIWLAANPVLFSHLFRLRRMPGLSCLVLSVLPV